MVHANLVGATLRHAREQQNVSGQQLADAAGISRRTLVKIEQGDDTVAFGSYQNVAEHLGLVWLFTLFSDAGVGTLGMPKYYLTGTTALALPGPGDKMPALWYSSSLADPSTWRIAGRDIIRTDGLVGVAGLWDATLMTATYGIHLPQVWAASPERAIFDLLIHYCEVRGKPVPNIQVSDIDDVVNIDQVEGWIRQSTPFLSTRGMQGIRAWLEGGY